MNNSLVRFMSKVSLPTESGCILWTGGKVGLGYGTFWFDGKTRRAHKWIWEESNGEVPIGFVLLHSCDNPSCVNLEHLSLGTQLDNEADKVQKGRHSFGEDRPMSKLTELDVRDILSSGESGKTLASLYSVSQSLISQIRRGVGWKHARSS